MNDPANLALASPFLLAETLSPGAFAGLLSVGTYGLALWALSVAPAAEIAALREISVVFAAIIAALFLGEAFGARRIALTILIAAGLVWMKTA